MWTAAEDKSWASLIATLAGFREDPHCFQLQNSLLNENAPLIKQLCLEYIRAGNKEYFNKYVELHSTLLDSRLAMKMSGEDEDLSNAKTLQEFEKEADSDNVYPALKEVSQFFTELQSTVLTEQERAFKNFQNVAEPLYTKHRAKEGMPILGGVSNLSAEVLFTVLHPSLMFSSPTDNPHGNPMQDWGDHCYGVLISKLCMALKKYEPDVKLDSEQNALVLVAEKAKRIQTLKAVTGFYSPGLYYIDRLYEIAPWFYRRRKYAVYISDREVLKNFWPEVTAAILLPTVRMRKFVKLAFKWGVRKKPGAVGYHDLELLMGLIMVEENPRFNGYKVQTKSSGKDPGFVLISPDGKQKWYAKYTQNVYWEYYYAQLLMRFGIKMPESFLETDEYGNTFIITKDLTRTYSKDNGKKVKSFTPLSHIPDLNVPRAFSFANQNQCTLSTSSQDAQIEAFLERTFTHKEARVSFAKLLIAGIIFGLEDLGQHGGNVGTLHSVTSPVAGKDTKEHKETAESERLKFAIVDFSLDLEIRIADSGLSFMELIRNRVGKMEIIFQKMFECLSEQDFMDAHREIMTPKERHHDSRHGCFVTQTPKTTAGCREILERTAKIVFNQMTALVPKMLSLDKDGTDLHSVSHVRVHAGNATNLQSLSCVRVHAGAGTETLLENIFYLTNDPFIKDGFALKRQLICIEETLSAIQGESTHSPEDAPTRLTKPIISLITSYWNEKQTRLRLKTPLVAEAPPSPAPTMI